MPLKLLLDENLRSRALWSAIGQHNAAGQDVLDVARVGDPGAPPLGISDAELITWAAGEGRILISLDATTLPAHLAAFVASGRTSAGIIFVREFPSVPEFIEYLRLVSYATDPQEWENTHRWIP